MPPAAAFECERTGWTLDMMATVAPASAAARAARWPASPAPMIRTSCAGMVGDLIEMGRAYCPLCMDAPAVRTLIVDDHADVRFLIRTIVGDAGLPVEVVGEADGVESALAQLDELV